jgi:XTP/dITP diphosphohydrolase
MIPRILIATSNAHKTEEIRQIMGAEWEVMDLRSHPTLVLPEETGETFEANAVIKAEAASSAVSGVWVLSDDSGLEVDALGGQPGVRSARYSGEAANDASNREKLKSELAKLEGPFPGRFRCCMAVAKEGRVVEVFHGSVEGSLRIEEEGEGGFGYDPLFVPDGFEQSFGVLPPSTKNELSHRARALTQVIQWLKDQRGD